MFMCLFISCSDNEVPEQTQYELEAINIPSYFPEMKFPTDNAFSKDRWLLGRRLFYDKRLSVDSTLSCASCHKQSSGFADNVSTTNGVKNRAGTRNVPSIANVGFRPYFLSEGGLATLEMQVLVPIQEHNEFDYNLIKIVQRLATDKVYQELAMKAYERPLDAFVITRAISTFERSLVSGNSKYDKFKYLGKTNLFTEQEKKGMALFFNDKTNCSKCHGGFEFTSYDFQNNGLYEEYADTGRYRLTGLESDIAKFKIPSLRNVGFTAPYMHDGSITTLDDVLLHYKSGGKNHKNKSNLIQPLALNMDEIQSLKAFLLTLNDEEFVVNKYFSEPK